MSIFPFFLTDHINMGVEVVHGQKEDWPFPLVKGTWEAQEDDHRQSEAGGQAQFPPLTHWLC